MLESGEKRADAALLEPNHMIHAQPHAASDPTDLLAEVLAKNAGGFVELRYHKKKTRAVVVEKGRVDTAQVTEHSGVGVRVLEDGTWGFASTDRVESAAIERAIKNLFPPGPSTPRRHLSSSTSS